MGTIAPPSTTAARRWARRSTDAVLVLAAVLTLAGACVKANPPTDLGNPVSPSDTSTGSGTTSLPSPTTALSYDQDMKLIFDSDCVYCHNNSFAAGRYSMSTYSAVLRDVVPGSASSRLVATTQPGGSMYRYFTGDRATKAALVRAWVVDNKAAQSR